MIHRKICQCFCLAVLSTAAAQAQTTCTLEQLTDTVGNSAVVEAKLDDGATTVLVNAAGDLGTGGNPDSGLDLFVYDIASSTYAQITEGPFDHQIDVRSIDSSGTRAVFTTRLDLVGMNPDGGRELYLWESGSITQLTNEPNSAFFFAPTISGDGNTVAFVSDGDFVGTNGDGSLDVFLFDISSNMFQQITNAASSVNGSYNLAVNADASVVAIGSVQDYLGTNPDESPEIYVWNGSLRQLTDGVLPDQAYSPTISNDGQRIGFLSTADPFGTNPDLGVESFLFSMVTDTLEQITSLPSANVFEVSLSGDGERLFFATFADLVGQNSDGSGEIYAYHVAEGTTTQVTDLTGATNLVQVDADGDGDEVLFFSTFNPGTNPDQNSEMFIVRCADTVLPPVEIPTQSSAGLLLLVVLLAWAGYRHLKST